LWWPLVADPVDVGLVASLARPGGRVGQRLIPWSP